MPGRLVMDVKEPQGLAGQKRDGSHLSQQSDGPEQKRIASDAFRAKLNGVSNSAEGTIEAPTINGVTQHGTSTQPHPGSQLGEQLEDDTVPELESFADTFVPFGKIIERMAQQTYFDLSEAVERLADLRIHPQAQLTNGVGASPALDKSPESIDKKLQLLNFAQTHKDRFIKALVLSDWARNMDDMTKLISVSMFLRGQLQKTHDAADAVRNVRDKMMTAKMPNPNIEGALELLTTGDASWMPDLGYIPPKPLSSQELLDTLSDMDFALTVRLNLHQDLPPHFQKYSIANGRATFIVDGEFEVDLAVADDEPDSPFYFIDLRLLFSPSTSINSDWLRNQLEARANESLAISGLKGCYDFLHNYVLTHKLNVLRCQALELARGKWIDNIKIEGVHRNVVIQYWKNQIGGRNWIELGISSGTRQNGPKQQSVPEMTCRWFRRGQEVIDHDLQFDFTNLSMESILNEIVAKHASGRLAALSEALQHLASDATGFTQDLTTSSTDAVDCNLQIKGYEYTMTLSTDPVRGSYCVQPQSKAGRDLERRLNNDAAADGAALVRFNFCRGLLNEVESRARVIGLERAPVNTHKGSASSVLRDAIIYISFTRPAGRPDCAITVTCDLSGPKWYLATITGPKDARTIDTLTSVESDPTKRPDTRALLQIEHAALAIDNAIVSDAQTSKLQLNSEPQPASLAAHSVSTQSAADWRTYFDPNKLLSSEQKRPSSISVYQNSGCCTFDLPFDDDDDHQGSIWWYRTNLRPEVGTKTIELLHRSLKHDKDLQIGKRGEVQVRWRVPPGANIYAVLRGKLEAIATLCSHVETLAKNHCAILDLRLNDLKFGYAPGLTCRVSSNDITQAINLDFDVQEGAAAVKENPHARIRKQLETIFQPSNVITTAVALTSSKLSDLVSALRATLPILQCAADFEKREPPACVTLHCHTAIEYRLAYRSPLRSTSFLISGKVREGKLSWVVKPSSVSGFSDQNRMQLAELLMSKGPGWDGAKTRALSTVKGIANCLNRFDELIRNMDDSPLPTSNQAPPRPNQQGQRPQQMQRPPSQQAQQNGARGNINKPQQKGRGQEVVVLD